ncbi:MAG: hypothetical protein AAF593_00715 [Planctomycetota bacterium]
MSTATLDNVMAAQADRKRQATSALIDLARSVAAGESPTPAEVAEILTAAGETAESFAETVSKLERRREWRTELDALSDAEKAAEDVRGKLRKADARLEAAEQAHDRAVFPLEAELDQHKAAINRASEAKRQLIRSVIDPTLCEAMRSLKVNLAGVEATLKDTRKLLGQAEILQTNSERGLAVEGGVYPPKSNTEYAADLKVAKARVARHTETVKKLEAERGELLKRKNVLEEQSLTP